jgi:hypothetical protein
VALTGVAAWFLGQTPLKANLCEHKAETSRGTLKAEFENYGGDGACCRYFTAGSLWCWKNRRPAGWQADASWDRQTP